MQELACTNDTPRTSGVKPESRQPQVRVSTVRSAGGGGRPGRPPTPSTQGQLLAEGDVVHAEGRGKRAVRRGAELHPYGLSPKRREAESPLRVDDARRLVEVGEGAERGEERARRAPDLHEEAVEDGGGRRLARRDVQPERQIGGCRRRYRDRLVLGAARVVVV